MVIKAIFTPRGPQHCEVTIRDGVDADHLATCGRVVMSHGGSAWLAGLFTACLSMNVFEGTRIETPDGVEFLINADVPIDGGL